MRAKIIINDSTYDRFPTFTQGEFGTKISFKLYYDNGRYVNLDDASIEFRLKLLNDYNEYLLKESCEIEDESKGLCSYTIAQDDLHRYGSYKAVLDVGINGEKNIISLGYFDVSKNDDYESSEDILESSGDSDDLPEGTTNLYYTQDRVRDVVTDFLVDTDDIEWSKKNNEYKATIIQSNIDHTEISNIGDYSHVQIDSHIDDEEIHFKESDINHTNIQSIGEYSHNDIDSHIDNEENPHNVGLSQLNNYDANDNSIENVEYINYNEITNNPPSDAGTFWYESDLGTFAHYDNDLNKILLGNNLTLRGRNISGDKVKKGQIMYVDGSTGDNPTFKLARADLELTSETLAFVISDSINNNANGNFVINGRLEDVDTSDYDEGDILYLSPENYGEFTNEKPEYPDFVISVGNVIRSHSSSGIIHVDIDKTIITSNFNVESDGEVVVERPNILNFNEGFELDNNDGNGTVNINLNDDIVGKLEDLGNLDSSITIDWSSATFFKGTLNDDVTISFENAEQGKTKTIILYNDETSQRDITWDSDIRWKDGDEPNPPGSSEILIVNIFYDGENYISDYYVVK